MTTIPANLQAVQERIAAACAAAGRAPAAVRLLAVSKGFAVDALRAAMAAGQRSFGESYVQEALPKIAALAGADLDWHFIGPLQSNKTRAVAEHFAWAHAIDRLKIAERLAAQRPPGLPPLQVCVEVNVSGEASKSGCAPAETAALCHAIAALPHLQLRGLMAIPAPPDAGVGEKSAPAGRHFAQLSALLQALNADGLALDTLSMGMSDDLDMAIRAGATWVRVGTAIFGKREYAPCLLQSAPVNGQNGWAAVASLPSQMPP